MHFLPGCFRTYIFPLREVITNAFHNSLEGTALTHVIWRLSLRAYGAMNIDRMIQK